MCPRVTLLLHIPRKRPFSAGQCVVCGKTLSAKHLWCGEKGCIVLDLHPAMRLVASGDQMNKNWLACASVSDTLALHLHRSAMSSHSTGASTDSKHAQTAYFIACDFCNRQIQGTHCFATVAGYLRLFGAGVEFRRTFLWRRAQTHLMNQLLDLGIDAIRDRIPVLNNMH